MMKTGKFYSHMAGAVCSVVTCIMLLTALAAPAQATPAFSGTALAPVLQAPATPTAPAPVPAPSSTTTGGKPALDTCTHDFPKDEKDKEGIITQIIDYIKDVIDESTEELYNGIIHNDKFVTIINAAFVLFVTLFGVMFMFGIVPLTLGQGLTRMFKMGIILALINAGFPFFNEYAITFFNDGTDELIDGVIGIATGDSGGVSVDEDGNPQPFRKLESLVMSVLSPEMMVAVVTSVTTGPTGPAMGGLLGLAVIAFIRTIIEALKIYCFSLIIKALLFGMAPIFISFLLFERTKHIFTGWLNQLVNFSLQPLLMFTFLSFYIVLLQTSAENILNVNICWTDTRHMEGTPNVSMMWRFVNEDGSLSKSDHGWEGLISCLQGGKKCPDFPISIIDVLTFFIIAHLASQFSKVVVMIATEISSSTLFLDRLRGGLDNYLTKSAGKSGNRT